MARPALRARVSTAFAPPDMIVFERKPPGAEDSKAGGTGAQIRWLDDPRDNRSCHSSRCARGCEACRSKERHKRHPAAVSSDKAPGCLHLQRSFGAVHARLTCEARRDPTVALTAGNRLYGRRSLRPHDCFGRYLSQAPLFQRGVSGELGPFGDLAVEKGGELFRRAADVAIAELIQVAARFGSGATVEPGRSTLALNRASRPRPPALLQIFGETAMSLPQVISDAP